MLQKLHFIGPELPKTKCNSSSQKQTRARYKHQMVRVGYDAIVIGGMDDLDDTCDSILKLSCNNGTCEWEILPQKLKFPRHDFVAMTIPDDFVMC